MKAIFDLLTLFAGPGALGGILLLYLRDRRKEKVATELAERTLGSAVVVKGAEGLQAQAVALELAFDMERKSKDRQLAGLHEEINELRNEIHQKDHLIASLRAQVTTLTERLERLEAQAGGAA